MKVKCGIFVLLMLLIWSRPQAQRLIDRSGTVTFFSEAPMENIEARNNQVLGAIDLEKGVVAVSMLMKGFRFEKALMEEHFNENYVESDKFPKASFKGKLKEPDPSDFEKNGSFTIAVSGDITIHGITKPLSAEVDFTISDKQVTAKTVFNITLADFDIDIPGAVVQNIAEEIEITASFQFQKN